MTKLSLALLLSLLLGDGAAAQTLTMTRVPPPLNIQVIGGQPASSARWPGTLVFRNKDGGGCTSTVVGDRVLLTAAHCVGHGEAARAEVDGGPPVTLRCDHHPAYPNNIAADFALCLASASLGGAARHEVINQDPALHAVGRAVVLLGYGCLTVGGVDKTFGQLYQGSAQVISPEANGYVVTGGAAAVCFGDSGGAAYSDDPIKRRVMAVNSRGDVSRYSWLSVTASAVFTDWARSWRQAEGASICGLDPQAKNCHQ